MNFLSHHLTPWRSVWYQFLVWSISVVSVAGQKGQIRFDRFSDDEGLPNNLFKEVLQDRDSVIWMAGLNGIARYDGYRVVSFRHVRGDSSSLSGNNVSTMYEDRDGRLWLGILGLGINVTDPFKRRFYRLPLPAEVQADGRFIVHDFTQDSLGRIWVASSAGDFMLEEQGGQFLCHPLQALPSPGSLDTHHMTQVLYTDRLGRVWMGTGAGLRIYSPDQKQWIEGHQLNGLPAGEVMDINEDRHGRIWVSIAHEGPRMYHTSADQLHFYPLRGLAFRSPTRTIRFAFDHDNRLWVSAFGEQVYGYDFRDSSVFLLTTVNSDIAHERFFRKPFVDHTGDVWLPCEGFYIHRFPKGFRSYLHPFGFHQSNTCISQDGPWRWMGYREKGLVRLNIQTDEQVHYSMESPPALRLPVNHIQDVVKLQSRQTLIVGFNSIALLDPEGRVTRSFPLGGTNRAGLQDSKGRIWIGGYRGLHLFSTTDGVIQTYSLPGSHQDDRNFIQAIEEDPWGQIWFASDLSGLAVLQPETGTIRQFLPEKGNQGSIPSTTVLDMAQDMHHHFWLATDVGLVHFMPDANTFLTYGARHGLANDYITAVICAKDGLVWVSTHAGISSFDPVTEQFINYTRGDGLLNSGYYTRSKFYDEDGILYFGGKNGVDYFHPSWLRQNPARPRMVFSSIKVNHTEDRLADGECQRSGMLHLGFKDNVLEFEITGLYFTAQDEVEYFYKMESWHTDWIPLGRQRHILMSGLKPGSYVFKAKAVSGDGIWSSNELHLPVTIHPPFYGTLWFRLSGLVVLLATLWGIVKVREKNITRKERHEAEVNRKMAELEKRALQAQMNPHFIYNSMNSIQQFMIVHDVEGAMKYLTRFSRILRTVLNMSAQNRIPLYDEVKLIEDYLELENMRFPDKFSYTIRVDPDINIHTVEIPPFFIQPQVENAIRHGLLKKPTPGHVQIDIRLEGEDLRIVVEDNGIGRTASMAMKGKEGRIVESKGLAIMEERLSHLHSHHEAMPMKITDLYDERKEPAGTRVEIFLPMD